VPRILRGGQFVVVILVYIFGRTHSTQWLAATGICRWAPGLLLTS
jgi:hypothetical protein